jgi:peptidoglycan/xylan/chitin deacetylase (PgdA/CDA1 family)
VELSDQEQSERASARRALRAERERARRRRLRVTMSVGALVVLAAVAGVGWALVPHRSLTSAPKGGTREPTASAGAASAASTPVLPASPGTATPASAQATSALSPPSTGAVARYALRYPDPPAVKPVVISMLYPAHKWVALTLDDGVPFDPRILTLLEHDHIRITTFLIGQMVKAHPDLVARMKRDGFEIANHTWDHSGLRHSTDAQVRTELSKCQRAISAVTGDQAPYLRPPGGTTDKRVDAVAASMGYRTVLWSRSMADTSKSATPAQLYKRTIRGLRPGEIILGHWGRPQTYAALVLILPELRREGFQIVTVSDLIADSGGPEALK